MIAFMEIMLFLESVQMLMCVILHAESGVIHHFVYSAETNWIGECFLSYWLFSPLNVLSSELRKSPHKILRCAEKVCHASYSSFKIKSCLCRVCVMTRLIKMNDTSHSFSLEHSQKPVRTYSLLYPCEPLNDNGDRHVNLPAAGCERTQHSHREILGSFFIQCIISAL